jgi:cell division topological specificity factor
MLGLFQSSKKTKASLAKERLQIVISHERRHRDSPEYLPRLEQEILAVVRQYVPVDDEAVNVNWQREDNYEKLELNVILPDASGEHTLSATVRRES